MHAQLAQLLLMADDRQRAKIHVARSVECLLEHDTPKVEVVEQVMDGILSVTRGSANGLRSFIEVRRELNDAVVQRDAELAWMKSSRFWRLRERILNLYLRLRPDYHEFLLERRRGGLSITEASVTEDEAILLRELVDESGMHPGPIVEIGTLLGYTTTRMAIWKTPAKQIITVDNYLWDRWGFTPRTHFEFTSLVLYYLVQTGHVIQCRSDKNEWFRKYDGARPALVFCDAIHTYEETKRDIDWALAAGARLISGHDYSPEFPGVMQAVNEAGGPERLRGTVWCLPVSTRQ